jgi:plastocyanin domain-containing protein
MNRLVRTSLLAISLFLLGGGIAASQAWAQPAASKRAAPKRARLQAAQTVVLTVTAEGFVPAKAKIRADRPVKLLVTRKMQRTCATEIVLKDYGIKKALPLNKPVAITFTPRGPGRIRFACAMDMISGELLAE